MVINKQRPRARQHEQIVSNKGRTAWIMELEKMLGASCIVPPVPGRTTDMWLALIISLTCHLNPVMNVVGHMVLMV